MSVAVPFYDKLLPLLGFSPESETSAVIDAVIGAVIVTPPSNIQKLHRETQS